MPEAPRRTFHRTTIYVTDEQQVWLRRTAAQARLDGLSLSASDVIRYALTRLRDEIDDEQLRELVVKHIQAEAKLYPGRAKRGVPEATG